MGNSSRSTKAIATISVKSDVVVEECRNIYETHNKIKEIENKNNNINNEVIGDLFYFDASDISVLKHNYGYPETKILPEVKKMTNKELSALCVRDFALMQGRLPDVVGACGQISKKICQKYGYAPAIMADGPAGIRITKEYAVEPSGKIKTMGKLPYELVVAKKLFAWLDRVWSKHSKNAKIVYQYCTSWPTATVQAQTFSPDLIKELGRAVAREMVKYNIDIWLAPGMNIQRHPLCGRNFEYYSEDPILTAKMSSAVISGVQENPKCAVTIKHYCCNNQEDNRTKSSSEVNERTLREIYLKVFKITIKNTKPKCVMSSYNKVNGTYVNSSRDLITYVLRCEFGFDGIVMTDWQSVAVGQANSSEVLNAENDLIMAGNKYQYKQLLEAVNNKKVDRARLERCASRILSLCKELN